MIEYDNQSKNIILDIMPIEYQNAELFIYDINGFLVWRSGEIVSKIINITSLSLKKGIYVAAVEGNKKFHCNKLCIG